MKILKDKHSTTSTPPSSTITTTTTTSTTSTTTATTSGTSPTSALIASSYQETMTLETTAATSTTTASSTASTTTISVTASLDIENSIKNNANPNNVSLHRMPDAEDVNRLEETLMARRSVERVGSLPQTLYYIDDQEQVKVNVNTFKLYYIQGKDIQFYKKNSLRRAHQVTIKTIYYKHYISAKRVLENH
jgi:hypothetical protein